MADIRAYKAALMPLRVLREGIDDTQFSLPLQNANALRVSIGSNSF